MKRFIILLFALVSVILLNVHLYFQYGFMPLILKAETINSYVDYSYFNVPNFDGYSPILKSETPDLDFYYRVQFTTQYETEYCPLNGLLGGMQLYLELYNSSISQKYAGSGITLNNVSCIQPYETYSYDIAINLRNIQYSTGYDFDDIRDQIILLDNTSLAFISTLIFVPVSSAYGYDLNFTSSIMQTSLEIRFNNYYLMSTFLLETDFLSSSYSGVQRPYVLYTETAEDTYNVYNDNLSTSFLNRTKFAIQVPEIDTAIVVNKIGTGWETRYNNFTYTMSSSFLAVSSRWLIYTLNASPMATPFDDAVIDTTPNYASCNEGLFGWPVECTIDGVGVNSFQAMANDVWEWLSKDSPIVSDLLALASSGFQWLDNSLQFLGFFSPTTLLGAGIWIGVAVLLIAYAFNGGE